MAERKRRKRLSPEALSARGRMGGRSRIESMTPEQLSEANRKAVNARWSRKTAEERKAWGAWLRDVRAANRAKRGNQ